MIQLCAPSLIYLIFSATQIIIDTFKGLYNTAFFKLIVSIIITILLNALCEKGLGVISWIIVFIPFMLMSVIVTILLYIFGLDVATGKINQNTSSTTVEVTKKNNSSPIKVFNPNYPPEDYYPFLQGPPPKPYYPPPPPPPSPNQYYPPPPSQQPYQAPPPPPTYNLAPPPPMPPQPYQPQPYNPNEPPPAGPPPDPSNSGPNNYQSVPPPQTQPTILYVPPN